MTDIYFWVGFSTGVVVGAMCMAAWAAVNWEIPA